uniref:Carbamoyl phosphate synthase small chain n=1 Tax=Dermonema virens TaxID=1077399 RepID=A0A1G4NRK2_9FLOR|nr:Carbamoyl phosphate synthase small subunit [Dermonema virens]SCW21264.1 Carbamoyl phosphate synthase small subunit [Dermonema virens]
MFHSKPYKTILILEDGKKYHGWSFSNQVQAIGEIVFNTGMTGYQEVITDPSYKGQIITFTYPELGNTGVNNEDHESNTPIATGIVAKNLCKTSSNWREKKPFIRYLQENKIPHIYGIDTRSLTKHLRNSGAMKACISTDIENISDIQASIRQHQSMLGSNMVGSVSTTKQDILKQLPKYEPYYKSNNTVEVCKSKTITIVVVDFGVKYNILRNLQNLTHQINISIVGPEASLQEILNLKPDGILLSNGPGDPSTVKQAISTVRELIVYKIPIFGICMGHQIMSLATEIKTFKLRFGHRGLNHPVGNKQQIHLTSQNHGFAVEQVKTKKTNVLVSETNYNDNTVASIVHTKYPCFAVQYHPEASPGPHDTMYLFNHFIRIVDTIKTFPDLKH